MAAIVGLAGAFLVTWLLSRRADAIVERRQYLDRLFNLISRLEDLRNRANTVAVRVEEVLGQVHDQRAAGCTHANLQVPRFETLSHTDYPVAHPTEGDLAALETLPRLYRQLHLAIVNTRKELARGILKSQPLEARGSPEYRSHDVKSDPFAVSGIGPGNFWSGLRQQQDVAIWRWQELSREYDRLAKSVTDFRERLIPASIYFLVTVLLVLVAGGIIAPLSFLTAWPGASKWILLSISASLVVSFVAYLGYEVWRLRQAADLARDNI